METSNDRAPRTAVLVARQQWLLSTAHVYRLSEPVPWSGEIRRVKPQYAHLTQEKLLAHVVEQLDSYLDSGVSRESAWEYAEVSGETRYIVVSAVYATLPPCGPETMAWACDERGEFLAGDERGNPVAVARSMNHDDAVRALSFEVVGSEVVEPPPPSLEEQAAEMAEMAGHLAHLQRIFEELARSAALLGGVDTQSDATEPPVN